MLMKSFPRLFGTTEYCMTKSVGNLKTEKQRDTSVGSSSERNGDEER